MILGGGQRSAAAVLAAIAGVLLPHEIPAQTVEGITSDSIAFLSAARKAATRYADRERAIEEGYRPLGPETPSMGAHWVHIGLIADHVFDPARPSLLSYVTVDGDPLLAGVGFALALDGGEAPPAAPDGGIWHVHAGTVAEEVREHGQEAAAVTSGPRVAVLHAWLGVPNHAGTFATENWSLPWVRLGLRPPSEAPVDAARAAAMAAGLADFYRDAWGTGEADEPIEAALMRATERARIVVGRVARGSEPDAAVITDLARLTREVREVARRARER